MFFRQVLHEDLGCASYVVADGGEAAIVDPKWEIEEYLDLAREHDFVRELTGNLAPQPPNFERIVELNRGPLVTETTTLEPLAPTRAHELLEQGATLVDG